ncbi:S-adenosyl-L-methionine dependent methyltransferase [Epithele typhae]|uniref:S-adenosyl-L-methionine dependent methyltransferase n=1 Tax=Epithele typhae TaxID=378194 RepID=UPI00200822A1|nr:S-adenosyl-L-methionine dependent methyltransferase [Epithele typhae]KAH9921568.1 S-adenosyl-L-methionine dependent methyltransferase [Epithele typhae]
MHLRNPYRTPPNFVALAGAFPALKRHLVKTGDSYSIDYKDENAQRLVHTLPLLHRDFGLTVNIPEGRLLNYLLWLEDVVNATHLALGSDAETQPIIRGLDIGTGASAIYPLLGCRLKPNWTFAATDIDPLSLECARANVSANGLEPRIAVVAVNADGPILGVLAQGERGSSVFEERYDFTMCNPPFYASREEVLQSAEAKEFTPNAVCTGAGVEMITPGGEAAFVGRMVEESAGLSDKCTWVSGHAGSGGSSSRSLPRAQIDNHAVAELVQGHTKRWVVAWSWGAARLPDAIGRLAQPGLQGVLPPRNSLQQALPQGAAMASVRAAVLDVLASVEGASVAPWGSEGGVDVLVRASRNTWVDGATPTMWVEWVAGVDRGLFEGFASHVERKVVAALKAGWGRKSEGGQVSM